MNRRTIKIIFPGTFKITLSLQSNETSADSILNYLRERQILTEKDEGINLYNSSMDVVSACSENQHYFLSNEENSHKIQQYKVSEPQKQSITQNENEQNVESNIRQEEVFSQKLKIEQKNEKEEIKVEKNEQKDEQQAKEKETPKKENLWKNKKQKILGVTKMLNCVKKTEETTNEKEKIVNSSKDLLVDDIKTDPIHKKTGLNLIKIMSNLDGTQLVNVKFYLRGEMIVEEKIKKMSIIKHPIMEKYNIFLDEELTKPLKKKTIAFGDRKFHCVEKIAKTEEDMLDKSEEFLQENPQKVQSLTKNIFRVTKKRPIKKESEKEEELNEDLPLKKSKSSILKVKKSLVSEIIKNNSSIFKAYKPNLKPNNQ